MSENDNIDDRLEKLIRQKADEIAALKKLLNKLLYPDEPGHQEDVPGE